MCIRDRVLTSLWVGPLRRAPAPPRHLGRGGASSSPPGVALLGAVPGLQGRDFWGRSAGLLHPPRHPGRGCAHF
eukprot:3415873-Lingulodinium_polyedra.AAC.1